MKKGFLLLVLFSFSHKLFAQTDGSSFSLPTVLPPAPQSAALGRYGDIPVSINTGVPNISVPLFTVSSGKLSLPMSISYHSSGVKVSDMASPAGLGWALNAGGDITRSVQGLPDESTYGFPTVRFPYANDPSLAAKEHCLANNICNTTFLSGADAWDGQPDLYFFSAGSKSGQFMQKNSISGSQSSSFMTIPYYPINIVMANAYQNFTITDDDGSQYFFNRYDSSTSTPTSGRTQTYATAWHLVKILSADKSDSIIFKYATVSYVGYSTNPSRNLQLSYDGISGVPTSLAYSTPSSSAISITEYLVSEIDFKNGKVTMDYGNAYAANQTKILNAVHLYNLQNNIYREIKRFTLYHSAFINNLTSNTNVSRLDSLQETGYYNNNAVAQPSTVFTYSTYGGFQCPPFQSFGQDFWGYFNGKTGNSDMDFVVEGTTGGTPSLPAAVSSPAGRMPDSNYMRVGALQSVKYPTGGVTTLALEANQIQAPVYVTDTVYNYGAALNVYISNFGASVGSTSGFSSTFTVDSNYAAIYSVAGGARGVYYNAQMTLQTTPMCTNGSTNCIYDQAFVQLNDVTPGSTGTIAEINIVSPPTTGSATQTALFNLIQGHTYTLYFPYQPVLANGSSMFQNRLDANITAQTSNYKTVGSTPVTETVLTGGLRVRSISSSDMDGNTLAKQYKYTGAYFNSSLFNGNYGTLATNFAFNGWKLYGTYPSVYWGNSITTYSPNLPLSLGSVSNNAISYNEVEEYEADGSGNFNGKTVYDYKILSDIVPMNMPFFRISNENARSLLTEKRVYKTVSGGYSLIQDIVNNYTDLDSAMTNADTVVFYTTHALFDQAAAAGPGLGNAVSGTSVAYSCLGCTSFSIATQYLINRYYYTTSRYVLKSSTTTDIDNNGNALASAISYDYQNPVHAYPTHTNRTSSAAKTIDTYTTYVQDEAASPSCTNNCAGSLSTQVSSLNTTYFSAFSNEYSKFSQYQFANNAATGVPGITGTISTANADSAVVYANAYATSMANYQTAIDAAVSTYNTCATNYNSCVATYYPTATVDQKGVIDLQTQNNIAPHMQDTRYTNGVLMSTLQNYYQSFYTNNTQPSRIMFSTLSNPLETRLLFNAYDTYGNLLQDQKASGEYHSYIWDYQNVYPVAEVTNAAQSSTAYTSFEADGTGNWSVGSALRDTTKGITGGTSYAVSNGAVSKSGLSTGRNYVVSYWTTNTSAYPSITGNKSGYPIQGKTITVNGTAWTYFEHKVTGISSVNINGTGNIDELRLYPDTALMTTYTYAPLVGVTSQCDANNRITYYQYDALGRLAFLLDQDRNVVKKYCYNYAGQPSNCTVYYNVARSQVFTDFSCPIGQVGSQVTYTVPADRYSASTQAAADSLAQNDINSNGQAYANTNGTCSTPPPSGIKITASGNTGGFTAVYTNVVSGVQTTFYLPNIMVSGGTLPVAATYNITISNTANTTPYLFTVCGTGGTMGTTSVTFNNVAVSSTSCNSINISTINN